MSTLEHIPNDLESYKLELERKINPEERKFLESELERSKAHHERMSAIVDSLEILKTKPALLVDAADKATMGKDWIKDLDQELVNYFVKIQTGQEYNREDFDYKKFVRQSFEYMFGFKADDDRLEKVSLIHGGVLPEDPTKYSLIIGTGGEINDFETQPQYEDTKNEIHTFFNKVLKNKTPFAVTCATHQILGQLIYENSGGQGSLVDNLRDSHGDKITESGSVVFSLSEQGHKSKLTSELDPEFHIMSHHGQYLRDLPPGSQSLAKNEVCQTQILEYSNEGQTVGVGFQGHPEISSAVLLMADRFERSQAIKNSVLPTPDIKLDTTPTYSVREKVFPKIFSMITK